MSHLLAVAQQIAPIDRDSARDAAARELEKGIYASPSEPWLLRALEWIFTRLGRLLDRASSVAPGGLLGLLLLVVAVVALVVILRMRLGPLRRTDVLTDVASPQRTADFYRAEAAGFAASGEWREALRARFRALIRELEQRGVLDQRAGRTAGEIAIEATAAMPSIGLSVREAADVFNEVWYGDRAATRAAYDVMVQADERVKNSQPALAMAAR